MSRYSSVLLLFVLASPADAQQKKLYFLRYESSADMRISRMNLDGTGLEDLVTGTLTRQPSELVIDPGGKMMYWWDNGPEGVGSFIKRANLEIPDGETAATRTDIESVVTIVVQAVGIALDLPGAKMYWADNNDFYKANFDGTSQELILDSIGADVRNATIYDPLAGGVPAVGGLGPTRHRRVDDRCGCVDTSQATKRCGSIV